MGDTNDAMFKAFAKRSAKSENRPASVRAGGLLKRLGGKVKDAAAAAGVSPSTFRGWLTGKSQPKAANSDSLNRANREALVPEGRRERLRKSADDQHTDFDEDAGRWKVKPPAGTSMSGGISMTADIKVSEDVRERTLNLGAYLSSGHMDDLMAAFLQGDEATARGILEEGLEMYFEQAELMKVKSLSFSPVGWEEED